MCRPKLSGPFGCTMDAHRLIRSSCRSKMALSECLIGVRQLILIWETSMPDVSFPCALRARFRIRRTRDHVLRVVRRRTVRTSRHGDHVVVRLFGKITAGNAGVIGGDLRNALSSDPQVLEIDLRGVDHLYSAGCRVFFIVLQAARPYRTRVIVTHASAQARRTIERLGLAPSLHL